MPKYYIMLVDDSGHLRIPVKALFNPYSGLPAFCADMPQFFGGTDNEDRPPVIVLENEVTQESRRTLELTFNSPPMFFEESNMFFYWAAPGHWQETGTPWGPTEDPAEQEMNRIAAVNLAEFEDNMTDEVIIEKLLELCNSNNENGRQQFEESATRTAFLALIRMLIAQQKMTGR